jgi:hypothetical protein
MMRTNLLVFVALLLCSCASGAIEEHNVLTAAEKADGWVLLFDGKTMQHWNDPRKLNPPGDAWTIEDSCLKPVSKPRISEDLVSSESYNDFELQWDWRISTGGNSGVKYRIQAFPILVESAAHPNPAKFEDKVAFALQHRVFDRLLIGPDDKAAIYPLGFEYQMIDNTAHPDAKRGPLYQTGALYSIHGPAMDATGPVGGFNRSKLVVLGSHFEHWLNGQKVLDITVTPELLKHALGKRWGEDSQAIQLFSQQPERDSPITLQNHGDAAWFRDIKIRILTR